MYLIGDIGINHNGSLRQALSLIKNAKDAGFNVVKFQKRTPKLCIPKERWDEEKISVFGTTTYLKYKELIEFETPQYDIINQYCKKLNIQWTASVFDIPSLHFILNYDIPFIKIPSESLTNYKLIKECIKTKKPIVLSVGLGELTNIKNAISLFPNNYDLTILYCVSKYPCDLNDCNLINIEILQKEFPNIKIGYSGHEIGYLPTLIAAKKYNIKTIERHITYDNNALGTDHKCSLIFNDMKNLVNDLNNLENVKINSNDLNLILGKPTIYSRPLQQPISNFKKNYFEDQNLIYQLYYSDNLYTLLKEHNFKINWVDIEDIYVGYKINWEVNKDNFYIQKYKKEKIKLGLNILRNGTFTPFFGGVNERLNGFTVYAGKHRIESLRLLNKNKKINKKFLFISDFRNNIILTNPVSLYSYHPNNLYFYSSDKETVAINTIYTREDLIAAFDSFFNKIKSIFPNGESKALSIINNEEMLKNFLETRTII